MGKLRTILAFLTIFCTVPSLNATAAPGNAPANFADPAFQRTGSELTPLVHSGKVKRSWYWGPTPGETKMESYAQGAGGERMVQYFDKSRMEINDPSGDKNNPVLVTNGLLTVRACLRQDAGRQQPEPDRYSADIPLAHDSNDYHRAHLCQFRDHRQLAAWGPPCRQQDQPDG